MNTMRSRAASSSHVRLRAALAAGLATLPAYGALAATAPATPPGRTTAIAIGGRAAPSVGRSGGTFDNDLFGLAVNPGRRHRGPVLNDNGQVAFVGYAYGTSSYSGIFIGGENDAVTAPVLSGTLTPDNNGSFSNFSNQWHRLRLNNAGAVLFAAGLVNTAGGTADDFAIGYAPAGGPVTLIARQGQTVPGGTETFPAPDTGAQLSVAAVAGPRPNYFTALNDTGTVAYRLSTVDALFRVSGGVTTRVTPFGLTGMKGPLLNNADGMATGTAGGVYYVPPSSGAVPVALNGQARPDGGTFEWLSLLALNNTGQLLFSSFSSGTQVNRVYRASPGGPATLVAVDGQVSPDGVGTLNQIGAAAMNDRGDVAFYAVASGTLAGTRRGVFLHSDGTMSKVARGGDPAPGGNGRLDDLFSEVTLGANGVVAAGWSLSGTTGGAADDAAIYLGDGRDFIEVAREGQPLAGGTIADLTEASPDVNSNGQVAYWGRLADGRQGVFLFTPDLRWRDASGGEWDDQGHWTVGLDPAAVHDVKIDPAASLTVAGPSADATVKTLQVGGGRGVATLRLQSGAVLAATGATGVSVAPTGVLTGDGAVAGSVHNAGTVVADNLSVTGVGAALNNNTGLVTGNGRITGTVNNAPAGTVRADAGQRLTLNGDLANAGTAEVAAGGRLEVLGTTTNSGRFDVIGGNARFAGAVTNASGGFIGGSDVTARFDAGLANAAGAQLSLTFGRSHLFGDIDNQSGGRVIVSGQSEATFYDDVVNNGEFRVSPGSAAVFFGTVSGAGTFTGTGTKYFEGAFSPGNSPALVAIEGDAVLGADAVTRLEIAGRMPGAGHDKILIGGTLEAGGAMEVVLLDDFTPSLGDRFDLLDFSEVHGAFSSLALPGLSGGLRWDAASLYRDGSLAVVPEPSVAALALLASAAAALRRRRG